MTFRPTLRPEVGIAASGELCDTLLARMVKVGAVTRAVVAAIDGARGVDEVLAHARSAVPQAPPEQVAGALRTLFLLTMIEGAGDTARARVKEVTSGSAKLGPVFLPEARFACQGSGQCCKIYEYGPLEPEDMARIEALPVAATYPQLGPGPYFEEKTVEGEKRWFLKRNGTRCIFLLPDTRCGIHAAFGGDRKPNLCRRFPFRTLLTIDGLKVFDQGECATYAVSARTGDTLGKQLAWLEPLLTKKPPLFHPVVSLDDRTGCDYAFVLALEKRLCELIPAAPTASAALAGMSGLVHAFRDALVACPLEAGEPEATIARVLGRDLASFQPPAGAAPPREGFASIAQFAQLLGDRIEQDPKGASLVSPQLVEALKVVCLLAAHRFDPVAHPAPEWLPELLAVEPLPNDTTEVLELSFRNLAFGDHLLVADRLVPALVRFAMIHLVTTIGARLRAWLQDAKRVRLEDLSFAHNIALVMTRKDVVRDVVLAFEDHADAMCRAAGALGGG